MKVLYWFRLKHQQKSVPKLNSVSFSDDLNINDPYNLASWQFNPQKNSTFYHRNLTEETLLSTGTPTSVIGKSKNDNIRINI